MSTSAELSLNLEKDKKSICLVKKSMPSDWKTQRSQMNKVLSALPQRQTKREWGKVGRGYG